MSRFGLPDMHAGLPTQLLDTDVAQRGSASTTTADRALFLKEAALFLKEAGRRMSHVRLMSIVYLVVILGGSGYTILLGLLGR